MNDRPKRYAAAADSSSLEAFYDGEYNPRLAVPDFARYFSRWSERAALARASLNSRQNLPYGTCAAECLDFFPAAVRDAPLLVFFHGGYWRALDKSDFSWIATPYHEEGVAVAVVNYGLLPAQPLSDIVTQVRKACIWLYRNAAELGVDATRFTCSGHSAGGHLVAMLMCTDWPSVDTRLPAGLLHAAIAISGLFDLAPLTQAPFLRDDLALSAQAARELSPAFADCRDRAPMLLAVGTDETVEFHRQSRLLCRSWGSPPIREMLTLSQKNHFSVCEDFALPGSPLFSAALELIHETHRPKDH